MIAISSGRNDTRGEGVLGRLTSVRSYHGEKQHHFFPGQIGAPRDSVSPTSQPARPSTTKHPINHILGSTARVLWLPFFWVVVLVLVVVMRRAVRSTGVG